MTTKLKELARLVEGKVQGDGNTPIRGVAGMREAESGDITFLANPKYIPLVRKTRASAVIVPDGTASDPDKPMITVENPDLAFVQIVEHFNGHRSSVPQGVHPTAVVSDKAVLGKDVGVGAHAVIEAGAVIGDGTILHPQSYVGHEVKIGRNCLLYPMSVVYHRCEIGDRVILHSGVVVGADGFGYATVKGEHIKIPQIGIVVLEDDVELGAGTTISRARFDRTLIKAGTKIDTQVQVGHNSVVGERNLIVSQVGIAGSTKLGKNVILGGQVGIAGHVDVGDGVIVSAQSGISKNVPPGSVVSGYHAIDHAANLRQIAALRRLPSIVQEVKKLTERIRELERELKKKA